MISELSNYIVLNNNIIIITYNFLNINYNFINLYLILLFILTFINSLEKVNTKIHSCINITKLSIEKTNYVENIY